jgi:signal-transduction protein with cAMP-binding, CBS, and nucleotidyltransferase domain
MKQVSHVIQQIISISEEELKNFLKNCIVKIFQRKQFLSHPNVIPNEIFFINKGIIRVIVHNNEGA